MDRVSERRLEDGKTPVVESVKEVADWEGSEMRRRAGHSQHWIIFASVPADEPT